MIVSLNLELNIGIKHIAIKEEIMQKEITIVKKSNALQQAFLTLSENKKEEFITTKHRNIRNIHNTMKMKLNKIQS